MKVESSVTDDDDIQFDDAENDAVDFDIDARESRSRRNNNSAEARRRIEEMMEEKWLRRELDDLDSYI